MNRFFSYIIVIALLVGQTTSFASNYYFSDYDIGDISSIADALYSLDLSVPALGDALVGMAMLAMAVVIVRLLEFYTRHFRLAKLIGTDRRTRAPPLVSPA
jgi:hypothetical protein